MASIVGHIIAARFLELSLRRYRARVLALEASPAFRAWRRDGRIEAHWFPVMAGDCRSAVLGQFTATGFRFACPEFAATYAAASGLPATPEWHLMCHVSRRNRLAWRLMRLIARHQAAWLRADDVLDLAPYAYAEVIADYRKRWPGRYIDAGIISRLVRHRDLLSPQGHRLLLGDLLPRRSQWLGWRIDRVVEDGGCDLSDGEIATALADRFGGAIGRRRVAQIRAGQGIPPRHERLKGDRDFDRHLPFTAHNPFDAETLAAVPARSGVYELSLHEGAHPYLHGPSPIVYLGATNSLKSRLAAHLGGNAHSRILRDLIGTRPLNLRWALAADARALEARLLHGFEAAHGALPAANKVRPRLRYL